MFLAGWFGINHVMLTVFNLLFCIIYLLLFINNSAFLFIS